MQFNISEQCAQFDTTIEGGAERKRQLQREYGKLKQNLRSEADRVKLCSISARVTAVDAEVSIIKLNKGDIERKLKSAFEERWDLKWEGSGPRKLP